jgi:IS30 family transposase
MAGRPRIRINWDLVDELLKIQCTDVEIASVLNISDDTLKRATKREKGCNYAEYSVQKRQGGHASLRRRQFEMANENPTMAIWLGKQYLGQRDKNEITMPDEINIKISDG